MNVTRMSSSVPVVFLVCWATASIITADEPVPAPLPAASHVVAARTDPAASRQPQILLRLRLIECQLNKETPSVERLLDKMDRSAASGQNAPTIRVLNLEGQEAADTERMLDQLRQSGKVRVLAEPTMVTLSGQKASLHCGGEIAIPAPDGSDKELRKEEFGTRLDVLPVLKPDGTLRLDVRLSVRELDTAHATNVRGKSVPGLRSRSVCTAVE